MKILFVDTYYPSFLSDYYRRGDFANLAYAEQRSGLLASCFGIADYYSRHLATIGVESEELIANCAPLQLQWAREQGMRHALAALPPRWAQSPLAGRLIALTRTLLPILAEQIRRARPDVLYMHDLSLVPPTLLASLRPSVKLIVGQIASPLPPPDFLAPYDLILTSFPHFVERLRQTGLAAEYFRLGFEPSVLERVGAQATRYACTFVGGISREHTHGTAFLEYAARHADVEFFGYGAEALPADSPIRARHRGPVWALDMYGVLAQSELTLNRHVNVAEGYANNMRLFEATGMGTMLLTDRKSNLGELFEVGKEVVAYGSAEEAVEQIRYYSAHPAERDAIARAGQLRTLRDHTYERRMIELRDILERHLKR
ncbi:MAG: glycosyl transferase group 1 family protein [bacterium]|nr:glycosyl transferase group 1 family protein [bacterium]